MIILTFKWISQNFLRIIRVILLQFHSINPWFFHFILLRSQEDYRIETFRSLISTKKNFVESFFKSIIFFIIVCYIFIYYILNIHFKERLLRTVSLRRNDWWTRTDTYPTFLLILVTLFGIPRANIRWWRPKQHDLKAEIVRFKIRKIIVSKDYTKGY